MNGNSKNSILIIDDDITIRKIIGHHLKENDYSIFESSGAPEGFKILKDNNIDLVLCDVTMDEMDGFTFCRMVREDENYRALPFIFVTASTSQEVKNKALEAGGDDIITKPFEINDLILKVKALLKRADIYKAYGAKKNLEESINKPDVYKVLLVDDDLSLARLFQYNLNKADLNCVITTSAEEGFKLAKANPPDIIISDIMMPVIDGYEFRRMLMADSQLKQIPFIFLTSKGDENDVLDGYDMGIADYVIKTSGPRLVVAKVGAILKSLGKERQKAVSELHSAADRMRAKVVPDEPTFFKGFDIKQWHVPYQGIPGGDFIDYVPLDEKNLAVILGDVMGKKWGAWYFAFAYAGYVRSALRVELQTTKEYKANEILQHVNSSVYQDAKISEVFATLSILILNNETGTVKYSGAGDLPIFYKPAASDEIKKIQSKGKLLGFAAEGSYNEVVIELQENDQLFLITDGVLESRNEAGAQFGVDGLSNVIKSITPSDDPVQKIKNEFTSFTNNRFEDDISLISIKVASIIKAKTTSSEYLF
jgi:sigma-B regulation protein RsbU (phosphoserine phosphatase)